ncbi:MAG: protein BatD [Alteromonadaceae bacterium]|nr:protein BatD [Alteromonadaceae bacterium]PCI63310.1 MAG: batD protein [Gammaproteobacteria bacterium]
MVKTVKILCLILVCFTTSVFANVSATVSKNPVIAGESFVLDIIANEDVINNAFNSDALLNDFIVGRTSISSQTSMINFKTSYSTRWKTVLIARKAGNYTIPVFNINGQKTAPIQLTVVAPSAGKNLRQQDLFIEAEVSNKDVYVQQQFTLKVKLYFASELKRGSLTEPSLTGATITQIGKDKENAEIINGRRYRVIERSYVINPQQSGDFTLSSPMFSGEVIKATSRRSSFLSFGESTPVSVLGKEIQIKVRPIPSSYQGQWLPSELLTIHDEWQPKNKKFKVGEPITRTITLTAAGLSEEQLPKLNLTMPKGLKIYPDQAELHTNVNNNKLVSQKVKNFAIVASSPGTYTLPKITIPWWNTITNKFQQAVLPEQTITIVANDDFIQTQLNMSNNGNVQQNNNNCPMTDNGSDHLTNKTPINKTNWLQWLFLALWLLTSIAWFIRSKGNKKRLTQSNKQASPPQNNNYVHHKNAYSALIRHCKENQGKAVIDTIVPWVNRLTNPNNKITTIDDALMFINDDDFTKAINQLQQCYYGNSDENWLGKHLLAIIKKIQRQYKKHASNQKKNNDHTLNLNP